MRAREFFVPTRHSSSIGSPITTTKRRCAFSHRWNASASLIWPMTTVSWGVRTSVTHTNNQETRTNERLRLDQDATLTQCLQAFIEPEILGPEDKWFCPNCKEHIQAEKKMSIWRLPPILIVHLKRFKYSQNSSFSYQSHSREKIETFVNFPIK